MKRLSRGKYYEISERICSNIDNKELIIQIKERIIKICEEAIINTINIETKKLTKKDELIETINNLGDLIKEEKNRVNENLKIINILIKYELEINNILDKEEFYIYRIFNKIAENEKLTENEFIQIIEIMNKRKGIQTERKKIKEYYSNYWFVIKQIKKFIQPTIEKIELKELECNM